MIWEPGNPARGVLRSHETMQCEIILKIAECGIACCKLSRVIYSNSYHTLAALWRDFGRYYGKKQANDRAQQGPRHAQLLFICHWSVISKTTAWACWWVPAGKSGWPVLSCRLASLSLALLGQSQAPLQHSLNQRVVWEGRVWVTRYHFSFN